MTFIKYLTLGFLLLLSGVSNGQVTGRGGKREVLKFIMNYQTYAPLKAEKVMLKTLPEKLSGRTDSLVSVINAGILLPDTLYLNCSWEIPNHARLIIGFAGKTLKSEPFYFDPVQSLWDVIVGDNGLIVTPHRHVSFYDTGSSIGLVALIRIFLEILLAFLIIKVFNWSLRFVIMTMAANIAAFPWYLLHFHSVYTTEGIVVLTEIAVMMLIGFRKAGWWRIIILALLVNGISFGMEQLMMLIAKLL